MKPKLSVVIPVYNEIATLDELVKRVRAVKILKEIILVDDASRDGSQEKIAEIAAKFKPDEQNVALKTKIHSVNKGKGAAVTEGFQLAEGDWVIIQDADLEYDPEEFHKLLAPIESGKATVVYGSRFTGEHRNMFFWHWVGNKMLTFVTNILYNTTLSDMETCYKVFPRELIQKISLRSRRFDFEPEVTAKILKRKIRIYEVPISYSGREFEEGKKITWRDGLVALWTLIKYRCID